MLRTLASYLRTGYPLGIYRLAETFATDSPSPHILIISDQDMFQMLDETGSSGRLRFLFSAAGIARDAISVQFVVVSRFLPSEVPKDSVTSHSSIGIQISNPPRPVDGSNSSP